VHRTAAKLLLPLDDDLFAFVCNIMLQDSVMQFDVGTGPAAASFSSSSSSSACANDDAAKQELWFDFASSLTSRQYAHSLPFSPRIHPPPPAPLLQLDSSGTAVALDDDHACPVNCNFPYWRDHPAFECCTQHAVADSGYDAMKAYSELSRSHTLPRNKDTTGFAYRTVHFGHFASVAHESFLTHALPTFSLVVFQPAVEHHAACDFEQQGELSGSHDAVFSAFRVLVFAENLVQEPNSKVFSGLVFRITVSSPPLFPLLPHDNYAFFGRISALRLHLACADTPDANEEVTVQPDSIDLRAVSDSEYQSALPPWFYSPGERWFELNSNASKDTLRALTFDVHLPQLQRCAASVAVSASISFLLRALPVGGGHCIQHTLHARGPSVTFDFSLEARPVTADGDDDAPSDLLGEDAAHRETWSDFACSGANRRWPHGVHEATALPESSGTLMDLHSVCILRNVCWIDQSIVMFLPPPYKELGDLGFLDFPMLGIGDRVAQQDSGAARVRFMWRPQIVFAALPDDVRFAVNITHFLYQKTWKRTSRNFGHVVFEHLAGFYNAMEMFDEVSGDARVVLLNDKETLGTIPRDLPFPLFPRASAFLEEYPPRTCFRRMLVGATSVTSLFGGWSFFRSAHVVRFRHYYLQALGLKHLVALRPRSSVVVNFYPRLVMGTHETWSDVCALSSVLSWTFPDAVFRCVVLHGISLQAQAQLISEAVVHVWPHGERIVLHAAATLPDGNLPGGSSYGLLFAAEGSSAIVLVDNGEPARELNVLTFLPFVNVYFAHRREQALLPHMLFRAMGAAASRMSFAMPASHLHGSGNHSEWR
jgi:hypothetical protein